MKISKSILTRITAMILAIMLIAVLGACAPGDESAQSEETPAVTSTPIASSAPDAEDALDMENPDGAEDVVGDTQSGGAQSAGEVKAVPLDSYAKGDFAVNVKITDSVVLVSGTAWVNEGSSAGDAVKKVCQMLDAEYTVKDGMYDRFNGKASTQTDGWLLYINGEVAQVGADAYKVKANDLLEFRYVNYDEAYFNQ